MLSDRIISSGRFSNRPLYLQLRDALAERIASGEWKPGSAIPNESDLAREFGVSAGTMRKALDLMEAERLLTRRQGRGTFVNDQSSDELAARFSNIRGARRQPRLRPGQVGARSPRDRPTSWSARGCGCGPTTASIASIACGTTRARSSWSRTRRCRPRCFQAWRKRAAVADRIIVLAQEYGMLLGKAEERVSLGQASPAVAQTLGVAAGCAGDGPGPGRAGARRPADRMAHGLVPSRRQVLHGGDGLTTGPDRGRARRPFAIRAELAAAWLAVEVSTCPFPKLPPRLRASPCWT